MSYIILNVKVTTLNAMAAEPPDGKGVGQPSTTIFMDKLMEKQIEVAHCYILLLQFVY